MLVYTILLCIVSIVSCQDFKPLIRQSGRTAKFKCEIDGVNIINQGLHWYLQDNSKNIKWLLFYKPRKTEALDDYKTRISLEISSGSSCILSITNIKPTDDGTYFCAAWHSSTFLQLDRKFIQYPPRLSSSLLKGKRTNGKICGTPEMGWLSIPTAPEDKKCSSCKAFGPIVDDMLVFLKLGLIWRKVVKITRPFCVRHKAWCTWKVFGSGTRLFVTDEPLKEPEVAILKSSPEQVAKKGFAIYMCNLQNFFPGLIKVAWYEGNGEKEVQSEQGEIEHNNITNTYSMSSWIKVPKYDLGKKFTCKYKHDTTKEDWKMEYVSGDYYNLGMHKCREYIKNLLDNVSPASIPEVTSSEAPQGAEGEEAGCTTTTTRCSRQKKMTMVGIANRGTDLIKLQERRQMGIAKEEPIYKACNQGLPNFNRMMYRAAQLTYAMLILKSLIYSPILIFIKYKTNP
ncbi:uncharacterized protein LOC143998038 [Lithobates pipiens]